MKTKISIGLVLAIAFAVTVLTGCEQAAQPIQPAAPVTSAAAGEPATSGISLASSAAESTITVNTVETVKAVPDTAHVQLGVTTNGATAEEAQQQNAGQASAFLDAIMAEGVAEDDIKTSYINIYQDYENPNNYIMDNTFSVTIRNIDSVGSVIDAAVKAGANSSYSLSFDISNRDEVYIEALGKAMQSVNSKAAQVAEAGGYTILRPLSIEEGGSSGYYDIMPAAKEMAAADAAGASVSTPISPGEIEVSASVNGTFVIQ
jgi:uncharacterized protein YggE